MIVSFFFMEKGDEIKALICQLIDNNQFILSALECIKQRGDMFPTIELMDSAGSFYDNNLGVVKISIHDVIDFCRLAVLCDYYKNPIL